MLYRILVADDEENILEAVKMNLELEKTLRQKIMLSSDILRLILFVVIPLSMPALSVRGIWLLLMMM
jgi:hypothetical protein